MTGHLALPAVDGRSDLPATLSPAILKGLLRQKLGFDGVITTDAMDMGAIRQGEELGEEAIRAAQAGADLLLLTTKPEDQRRAHASLVQAIEEGRLDQVELLASAGRIRELKHWIAAQGSQSGGVGAVWIPDLTRLLFIWMVFLGTALIYRRKRHLVIDFLLLKFPRPARRTINALIAMGMLGLAGVMAVVGWRIMQIRMDIPYTGLEIPTGYAYLAVPVAAALMALTSLANLWEWVEEGRKGEGVGGQR